MCGALTRFVCTGKSILRIREELGFEVRIERVLYSPVGVELACTVLDQREIEPIEFLGCGVSFGMARTTTKKRRVDTLTKKVKSRSLTLRENGL